MTDSMWPVVMLIAMSTTVAGSLLVLSYVLGPRNQANVDRTPYECGAEPFEKAEDSRFSMHFYLVAMLLLLSVVLAFWVQRFLVPVVRPKRNLWLLTQTGSYAIMIALTFVFLRPGVQFIYFQF